MDAKKYLKEYFGHDSFRMVQENIINSINDGNSTLGIMPTGGGKSVCYQIPALMKDGLTVVISPLKSLMEDQVKNMRDVNIPVGTLNSGTEVSEKELIYSQIQNNELKMLLISPERAVSTINYLNRKKIDISQFVFDEAHCLSQWGHDFRPDYKKSATKIRESGIPIIALTATADNRTREDIQDQLGIPPENTFVSGFNRPNIHLSSIYKNGNGYEQIKDILLNRQDDTGIIFAATKNEADKLHDQLKKDGFSIGKYHSNMTDINRKKTQKSFMDGKTKVIVATTAFGMGVDKSNVRFTLHSSMPYSVANYAQEFGRAGRDGGEAEAMILYRYSDINRTMNYMNDNKDFDRLEKYQEVVDIVTSKDCLRINVSKKFGEEIEKDCAKCSSCDAKTNNMRPKINIDLDEFAKTTLEAMDRMNTSLTNVVDTLAGSKIAGTKPFRKDPSFGSFNKDDSRKRIPTEDLKQMANELVFRGYIDAKSVTTKRRSNVIIYSVSDIGYEVIAGNKNAEISIPNYDLPHEIDQSQITSVVKKSVTKRSTKPTKSKMVEMVQTAPKVKEGKLPEINNKELFDALVSRRSEVAGKFKIPEDEVYKIISTSALAEIANSEPEDRKSLEGVSGVGRVTMVRHSQWILSTVDEFKTPEMGIER